VRGFADLPSHVQALAAGGAERVALILVDGFGRAFLERHAAHPVMRRLETEGEIEPVASMFPTTTTAHLTTLYTTLPVGEHGLYEWNVYEPSLNTVILPLPFIYARRDEGPLPLAPEQLVPGPTLFERLAAAGTPCSAIQPSRIWPSSYSGAAFAGAWVVPFDSLDGGRAALSSALVGRGFTYFYWDGVDYVGHRDGPSSAAFDTASRTVLDAIESVVRGAPRGTVVMITADHGQVDVHPRRLDLLDELWPPLLDHLRRDARERPLAPAGSARDCFLHVEPGYAPKVVEALAARLGERAEVRLVADLVAEGMFGAVGPALEARLADVCVLPAPGRMAWLRAFPGPERLFRGHHGGLAEAERETWLGTLVT
jgi:hypothetical protein